MYQHDNYQDFVRFLALATYLSLYRTLVRRWASVPTTRHKDDRNRSETTPIYSTHGPIWMQPPTQPMHPHPLKMLA